MPGNALDLVLVVAALLFAVSGYRQGFVVGVLSFIGFLGGGVLGAKIAPGVAAWEPLADFPRAVVGLVVVFAAASMGQILATVVGGAVRQRITYRSARQVDAFGGAVVSVLSLLLVAWLVGRAVASSSYPALASQVRRSVVIHTVDGLVPPAGERFFAGFRDLIDERGFPEVFDGLEASDPGNVEAPRGSLAKSPVVQRVRPSVVKITGEARSCRKKIEGTGFVYATDRVMTNAHVVAGVAEPQIEIDGKEREATVVLFDPGRDLAVLAVKGLGRPALAIAPAAAESGDDGIVLGYPKDGPFQADAARVIRTQSARGDDIYGERTVVREVYSIKSLVQPGNSGGPLIDPQGRVLGVIFAAAADDQSVGYALTWKEAASSAQAGAARSTRVSTRTCD